MTFCYSLLDLQKKKKGKREMEREIERKENTKEEASFKILRDIQFSDHDVLLSASPNPEQMLNGLIDRHNLFYGKIWDGDGTGEGG